MTLLMITITAVWRSWHTLSLVLLLVLSSLLWYRWYCQYQWTDSDTENYRSVWGQTHYDITDNNNNGSLKVLTYIITSITYTDVISTKNVVITNIKLLMYWTWTFFPFISPGDIVSINELTDTEDYLSVWGQKRYLYMTLRSQRALSRVVLLILSNSLRY
jgi:hypothetical protein